MHAVILNYCVTELFTFANDPTCMRKSCIFFCKRCVVLKRTGSILESDLESRNDVPLHSHMLLVITVVAVVFSGAVV